ncbi:MAG: single-stranded-DNA-specific exonuclease RecJ [Clostridia bacterium]|nr:single-stranded-DNA-specific exonuclease RecJ [Clostridia bacterium]
MKKIIYNQNFSDDQLNIIRRNALNANVMMETSALLYSRGMTDDNKIRRFLNPGKKNFLDPFLLSGMVEAVDRLELAKENDETVLVYGDYDADGISATAVLTKALVEYGVNVIPVIPNREDGYGLNISIIEKIAEDAIIDLIITVDCGISNVKEVDEIKELGIDVIVTDHHEIPDVLPDTLCINPKLDGDKTFSGLCGAGVAFKLATALLGERAYKYLDYVALATVADSMELVSENRDIVHEGLKLFTQGRIRPAFSDILSLSGSKEVTAQSLAYSLAPRINAAGRMGDAGSALKLFLSDDPKEIYDLSVKLNEYNLERQAECDKLYKTAKQQLALKGANKKVIMLYNEDWKTGFVGIVAARLAEEFTRPVIIFAGLDGILKGSARSIDGINIFEAISYAKDLLEEFGGHSQAAGVAIKKENFAQFEDMVDKYLTDNYSEEVFIPKITVESEINGEFSFKFAKELDLLEPYGVGNRKPLFVTTVGSVNATTLKPNSPHVSFKTKALDMLKFNGVDSLPLLDAPIQKKVVFEVNLSTYARQVFVKGYVKDVLPVVNDDDVLRLLCFENAVSLSDGVDNPKKDVKTLQEVNNFIKNRKSKYSTAFILSDLDNLKYYPDLLLEQKGIFKPTEKNLLDVVLLAPISGDVVKDYDNIVYLDTPLTYLRMEDGKSVIVVKDMPNLSALNRLDLSRQGMIDAFIKLKALNNKRYSGSTRFYLDNKPDLDPYQCIFALAVFSELKIFNLSNGVLKYDNTVKSDLMSSKLYQKAINTVSKC